MAVRVWASAISVAVLVTEVPLVAKSETDQLQVLMFEYSNIILRLKQCSTTGRATHLHAAPVEYAAVHRQAVVGER